MCTKSNIRDRINVYNVALIGKNVMKKIILLLFIMLVVSSCSSNNDISGAISDSSSITTNEKQKNQDEKNSSLFQNKEFIDSFGQSSNTIKFKDDSTVEFYGKTYKYTYENTKNNKYVIYTDSNYSIVYDKSKAMITIEDAKTEYFYDKDAIEIININMDNFENYFNLVEEVVSGKVDKFGTKEKDKYYYYYVFNDTTNSLIERFSYLALKYSVYGDHNDYVIDRQLSDGRIKMDACSALDFTHKWDSFKKDLIDVTGEVYLIKQ